MLPREAGATGSWVGLSSDGLAVARRLLSSSLRWALCRSAHFSQRVCPSIAGLRQCRQPLEDLLALRPAYLDPQAPVFGISDGQVGRRIRAAAPHAGTELTDLQNAGRWQSPSMPARYSRGQRASRGAVARYYGVDG